MILEARLREEKEKEEEGRKRGNMDEQVTSSLLVYDKVCCFFVCSLASQCVQHIILHEYVRRGLVHSCRTETVIDSIFKRTDGSQTDYFFREFLPVLGYSVLEKFCRNQYCISRSRVSMKFRSLNPFKIL